MSKSRILFLVVLAALLGAWRFISTPSFADAFLSFVTAGEIPVTHYVLTPDDTIRLAIGLSVITMFVVFRKEFFASMPRRRKHRSTPVPSYRTVDSETTPVSAMSEPTHVSHTAMPVQAPTQSSARAPIVIKVPRRTELKRSLGASIAHSLLAVAARLAYYLLVFSDGTKVKARAAIRYCKPRLILFAGTLSRYARRTLRWLIRTSKKVWRYVFPYLKAADRAIENVLRQNKKTATFTEIFDESTKMSMRALRKQSKRIRKTGRAITARVFKA